jgi:hypothetical protein
VDPPLVDPDELPLLAPPEEELAAEEALCPPELVPEPLSLPLPLPFPEVQPRLATPTTSATEASARRAPIG